ncbi:MAG TPA: calcium-binding protein [Allosphingosinicella sp.]|jgi:Ca2+-binding RTX toxin-like protein|nr:calcium-binding protein [Allosphingosinicella sp.]
MAYIQGTTATETLNGTSSNDQIYGLDGYDFLYGFDGDDTLVGGDGDDTLDGGTGADFMDGGQGNDTYYVDNSGDVVVEAELIGNTDIVYVSIDYFDAGSAHLERIHYSGNGSATFFGSDSNNFLGSSSGTDWLDGRGGNDFLFAGAGDDHLEGGSGNDELDGWQGNDTMVGGTGDDVYNVDSASDVVTEYADEGIDTVKVRKSSYTLPANVENADLRYYSGSISVTGNSAGNVFIMGVGAQSIFGSSGNDTASYAYASAAVSVDLWTFSFGGEAADDYFSSIENLTGSAYDDVLRALGTASVIDGGPGADTMEGRNGGDIYYVDNAGDVVIEVAGGGSDEVRIRNLASYTLPDYVEKLTNTTNFVFSGTGNSSANEINGGTAGDTLYGAAGNDTLNGGAGDDELHGDGEHDILNGGSGADLMYGGLGNDTFQVDAADTVVELSGEGTDHVYTSLVSYTLPDFVENLTFTGTGDPALNYTGNSEGNILIGRGGADIFLGLGGADELRGGTGDDVLHGGAGDDLLIGGSGVDLLNGGSGGDLFRFAEGDSATGNGADGISDFVNYVDKVDLQGIDANQGVAGDQAFTFIGTAAFSGTAGELRYGMVGSDTVLQGDMTGDGVADFEIVFIGNVTLFASDFYL